MQSNGVSKSASAAPDARTLPEVCDVLRRKVTAFLEERTGDKMLRTVQGQVKISMAVIEEALSRYDPSQLSMAYNGGKDCLVLLVLILACLPVWAEARGRARAKAESGSNSTNSVSTDHAKEVYPGRFPAVYVLSKHPFEEVEDFVAETTREYHLDLSRYNAGLKDALGAYLNDHKSIQAVFVGTRRTDPHGELLTHFDPTDPGWPQFMRIHPVIDWHYAEIWAFLRHLEIPYCRLYDRGFTSLGGVDNTHRNPALAVGDDHTQFRPAYELMADEEERLGRDS